MRLKAHMPSLICLAYDFRRKYPIKTCMASKVTKLIFSYSSEIAHPDMLWWCKKLLPKFSCLGPFNHRKIANTIPAAHQRFIQKSIGSFLDLELSFFTKHFVLSQDSVSSRNCLMRWMWLLLTEIEISRLEFRAGAVFFSFPMLLLFKNNYIFRVINARQCQCRVLFNFLASYLSPTCLKDL